MVMKKNMTMLLMLGPWVYEILKKSGLEGAYKLDLIRGSHILFKGEPNQPYFLQAENDGRIFVLPYNGNTLIGTTGRQNIYDLIAASNQRLIT